MMRKFFYIRVSSYDQSIERQLIAAKELGIPEEYIFVEKASGRMFRKGDLLYLQLLDRLGRNKQMILEEWRELTRETGKWDVKRIL